MGRNTIGEPYIEAVYIDKAMKSVLTTTEAAHRSAREDLKLFDEVMEQFRKHVYSLRRLILCGTQTQNGDMLRMYLQVELLDHAR